MSFAQVTHLQCRAPRSKPAALARHCLLAAACLFSGVLLSAFPSFDHDNYTVGCNRPSPMSSKLQPLGSDSSFKFVLSWVPSFSPRNGFSQISTIIIKKSQPARRGMNYFCSMNFKIAMILYIYFLKI